MPTEAAGPKMRVAGPRTDIRFTIPKLAGQVARLAPGPAAALRRGRIAEVGNPAFWQLMAEHAPDAIGDRLRRWAVIMQAIAILTPKGRALEKRSAHDASNPMGAALFEAGISELRLARLLSARGEMRRDLVIRSCRRMSAKGAIQFDLRTLGTLILSDEDNAARWIARTYYSAAASAQKLQQGDAS